MLATNKGTYKPAKKPLKTRMYTYRWFYLMIVPVFIFVFLFNYLPMLGIRFAFYEYTPFKGPNFTGLDNFAKLISNNQFWTAFGNTWILSVGKLLVNNFAAVLLSLLINEVANIHLKKFIQTLVYLPHFLSWVVVASIFSIILSPQSGFVNELFMNLGLIEEPVYFLADTKSWRWVYFFVNIWKDTGWGTVIFLATLTGINPELYEAARMDGATRIQQMRFITLPALADTIIIVLILNLAKVMNLFESVLVMYNPKVYGVADVLQTYVYRQTLTTQVPNFGYSTAVGLFRSLVGCVLVLGCNWASKKARGRGII
ncbi:MAG: sugar ABC transporter permease [Cellulosilyticum sp.]|nr:sugar ABC transporter permease [Cellulosilyticum sp.]